MTQIDLQIILFFILVIYIIYRILVKTSSKVKKFNEKNHFINFIFVGIMGAEFYLINGNACIAMLVTIIFAAAIIYENKKMNKKGNGEDQ